MLRQPETPALIESPENLSATPAQSAPTATGIPVPEVPAQASNPSPNAAAGPLAGSRRLYFGGDCACVDPGAGMKKAESSPGNPAAELISQRIAELGDWRGKTLARMRKLIHEADPDVVEEWKWMGTPVWSHDGNVCTGEAYRNWVKLTFAKGASLEDPAQLFNASLDGKVRRAIDIREGEQVDAAAFKALFRQAVALNAAGKAKPAKKRAAG